VISIFKPMNCFYQFLFISSLISSIDRLYNIAVVLRSFCEEELKHSIVEKHFPSMAPSLSGGRKGKRGRREWDEGGSTSGTPSVRELTHQARRGQRRSVHGPGT
jgi:hypothetical protein